MVDIFVKSMERCVQQPLFLRRFYARFLLSSDEIGAKFANIDMKRQEGVLRASVYHILRAAQGAEDGRAHLNDIAESHSKRGLDIRPEHYQHWLECMIAVAREVEPTFDAVTEAAWRHHLGRAIDVMISRYDKDR